MSNAVNKILSVALAAVAISSCGNSEKQQAEQLCDRVESEVKAGNFEAAMTLLDTLDVRYASEVEVRRSAMKFRAMAVEGLTIRRITSVDDTLARLSQSLDNFQTKFDYVKNPGENLGGNYIDKTIAKKKYDILPRINDDGYFTLSVAVSGRPIEFSHVIFVDGSYTVSTAPVSSSRLVKVENTEMTVLQQEEVSDAVYWLAAHPSTNGYELVGSKNKISKKLTPDLYNAIVTTWQYALDKQAYRQALIEREKLERKLQLCRDQLANVIDK